MIYNIQIADVKMMVQARTPGMALLYAVKETKEMLVCGEYKVTISEGSKVVRA